MILFKNTGKIFLSLLISLTAIYYYGCASAESTTGKLAFQQQDYIKAEAELKKGLQIDPKDAEGWYMLGVSQTELGKLDEARESFNKCTSLSSSYGENINRYWIDKYNAGARDFKNGIDAEEKKDTAAKSFYSQALLSFQASAVIIPDSLKSFSAIGETYLALGMQDSALAIFTDIATKSKSKEAAEKVAKIIFESGLNMMSVKNYEAAIKTFSSVLDLSFLPKDDPYYETSAYNKALALAKVGDDMRVKDENSDYKAKFSEALQILEPLSQKVLTNKDIESKMYELLVRLYAELGMNDKAEDALKKKESLKK